MGVNKFEKHERVMRTWDNRLGVVRDHEGSMIGQDAFLVRWLDGGEEWVKEDELVPA